jgi:two-component system phosphate regulon response regulator PhoB
MKKQASNNKKTLKVDGVTLDIDRNRVSGPNGTYHLTPLESRLLQFFMRHPDQIISLSHLMREVWETEYLGDLRTLYVHIAWLRQKLELDPSSPRRLITHRGMGYQLRARTYPSI